MDYGDGGDSGDSTDESRLFSEGLHSGGSSLQLQLQEYAQRRPGRLASRLLQKMQTSREGGGAVDNLEEGNQDTTNRHQLDTHDDGPRAASASSSARDADPGDGPRRDRSRSLPVRGRRAGSEDQGRGAVPERRHVEQSAVPRAAGRGTQPAGTGRGRDGVEGVGRRTQDAPASGKTEQKGGHKDGGRTEQKGGKDPKKGRGGKGKDNAPAE